MKRNTILSMITVLAVLFLTSCGGGSSETKTTSQQEPAKQEEIKPAEIPGLAAQLELGEKIYNEKCIVCHQADANGLKGAFPPLANADYLIEDIVRGASQTLNGSNEEMIINGETYNAPMTPQVETKEDAVAVINYVLKHFNGFTDDQLLTMEDVKDVEINPIKL
ncbi:MAG: cytochrome c [Bacteroidales bacterium]|nr:cytochrome c [Bacteroidales bacterium]